jgi:hypothetical protein
LAGSKLWRLKATTPIKLSPGRLLGCHLPSRAFGAERRHDQCQLSNHRSLLNVDRQINAHRSRAHNTHCCSMAAWLLVSCEGCLKRPVGCGRCFSPHRSNF